jgi:hypothetical protein
VGEVVVEEEVLHQPMVVGGEEEEDLPFLVLVRAARSRGLG